MLDHAAALVQQLDEVAPGLYVSANVAASRLLDPSLPRVVAAALERHQTAADRLMIEITESERLGSARRWEESVRGLQELGVKLAIDDFGAGYSSVARLSYLPITHLKLDRSLVVGADGPLGEVVAGVAKFCRASNVTVIAEGIETVADHRTIRSAGVDHYQGYLFGRPARIDDLIRNIAGRVADCPVPSSAPV